MNKQDFRGEIERLRRHLDDLAADTDDELARYEVLHPGMPPGVYWKLRWLAGRMVRLLESIGIKKPEPWPAGLKQIQGSRRARALLLWAVGTDRDTLREACRAFADVSAELPEFAPVLVTDVADFTFFSRLGWLVEYLPELPGEGQSYAGRKARFVARLYRSAPAVPVRLILEETSGKEVRRWLKGSREQ